MAFTQGHALLIGVGHYFYIPESSIPISVKDAQQVGAVLGDERFCGYPKEQVTLLSDHLASKEGILQAFQKLAEDTKAEDTALVYYSGHGAYGADGLFYMTTCDTRAVDDRIVPGTAISEQELLAALRAIPAGKLLFFFNACHAGEVSPHLGLGEQASSFGAANLPNAAADAILASGSGRVIVTACRDGQKSWIGKGEISLFARALAAGLKGEARHPDGYIGAFGLYEYLFETVQEAAGDLGQEQTPELTVLKGVGPFPVALCRGASPDRSFDPQADQHLPDEAAARQVSERASQRAWRRFNINTGGGAVILGDVNTGGGDFVGRDQNKVAVQGSVNAPILVGENNSVQNTYVIDDPRPKVDAAALRRDYLNALFETVGALQLNGIDPKAASEHSASLSLGAVYTALLTQTRELPRHEMSKQGRQTAPAALQEMRQDARQQSALEMLNACKRLVLLGDPGSGKSTFVNFAALCLSGQALGHASINLALLTAPLPVEEESPLGRSEQPQPQPWEHGALLPVRVVLRDFAARGLPPAGQKANASHLWDFIASELENGHLQEFAPFLQKELREQGGLLLVDGLDEVTEAEQRRAQIRQAVEDFARGYPRMRILVTSRTYAYQNQDWRLKDFTDTQLAPFSRGQINTFVDHWYAQIAKARNLHAEDAQGKAALLKRAIFTSDRLMGLAERPLLLTLMASLHAWRGGTLPEKREQLYADTVDLLLDWWESPKTVRDGRGGVIAQHPSLAEWLKVDRAKVRALLEALAFQAHAAQPDLVGTADVTQAALVDGLLRVTNNAEIKPARLVEFLRDRAGLLVERGEGVFTFPHRTFQEYLAACYLTDHDYPEKIAELACQDFNRWREAALLAGAKAGRGTASAVWSLVDALCYENAAPIACRDERPLWGAHLAAQALLESGGLENVSERNRPKVERVRGWLAYILQNSAMPPALPASERCLAGNSLAGLGDPRFSPDLFYLNDQDDPLLGFVEIPAGPFWMGSNPKKDSMAQKEEQPYHEVNLSTYYIARFPVTVAQFRAFVDRSGYQPGDPDCLRGTANHPVVWVYWRDAQAYCNWLDQALRASANTPPAMQALFEQGWRVKLPTEAQWEKAARGADGRIYPWGNDFDANKANTFETGIGSTSPVGCFEGGKSPYGIQDMSGNVLEWCLDWYDAEYYAKSPKQDPRGPDTGQYKWLRGGSWGVIQLFTRCASRVRIDPGGTSYIVGFRCVLSR